MQMQCKASVLHLSVDGLRCEFGPHKLHYTYAEHRTQRVSSGRRDNAGACIPSSAVVLVKFRQRSFGTPSCHIGAPSSGTRSIGSLIVSRARARMYAIPKYSGVAIFSGHTRPTTGSLYMGPRSDNLYRRPFEFSSDQPDVEFCTICRATVPTRCAKFTRIFVSAANRNESYLNGYISYRMRVHLQMWEYPYHHTFSRARPWASCFLSEKATWLTSFSGRHPNWRQLLWIGIFVVKSLRAISAVNHGYCNRTNWPLFYESHQKILTTHEKLLKVTSVLDAVACFATHNSNRNNAAEFTRVFRQT